MWRTHKSRGETSWQALSRLPVAWCRTGGISSGNKLVQSPILIALLEEEQLVCSLHFHPLPLCLATEGWQADKKNTAKYLLLLSSPSRRKPSMPVESVRCHARSILSACCSNSLPRCAVQLKLFFHTFLSLMQVREKNRTKTNYILFPQIASWLTNTSSCQAGVYLRDDTSVEKLPMLLVCPYF